jgi:hypothetical protein
MGAPLSRAAFRQKLLQDRNPAPRRTGPQESRSRPQAPSASPSRRPRAIPTNGHHRRCPNCGWEILRLFRAKPKEHTGVEFLREKLAGGPQLSSEVFWELAALGVSERTAKRARKSLGMIAHKEHGQYVLFLGLCNTAIKLNKMRNHLIYQWGRGSQISTGFRPVDRRARPRAIFAK